MRLCFLALLASLTAAQLGLAQNTPKNPSEQMGFSVDSLVETRLGKAVRFGQISDLSQLSQWNRTIQVKAIAGHDVQLSQSPEAPLLPTPDSLLFLDGKQKRSSQADVPRLFTEFEANPFNGFTPPDNAIAISKRSVIVAAVNANLAVFDRNGRALFNSSFSDLLSTEFSDLNGILYDPRVLYDEKADRFIFVVLHGRTPTNSQVIIGFSKEANPLLGWNFYTVRGNLVSANTWFDYPNVAINDNELFIAGNLFGADDQFKQAVVLQIDKAGGFEGQGELKLKSWNGMQDASDQRAFSLYPVTGTLGFPYGPNMFLVSTRPREASFFQFYSITGSIDDPDAELLTRPVSVPKYYDPGVAQQRQANDVLDNGDCRVRDAFFLNGFIHMTHGSSNVRAQATIAYHRWQVWTENIESKLIESDQRLSYAYPTLAPIGNSYDDPSTLIGFLSAGLDGFASLRVLHINEEMEASNSVLVAEGDAAIDLLDQDEERWGDYIGMVRKIGSNTAWLTGCLSDDRGIWRNYIAEISLDEEVSIQEAETSEIKPIAYPNPVSERISIDLSIASSQPVNISIWNMRGQKVKVLLDDRLKLGDYTLSFDLAQLAPGAYTLIVKQGAELLQRSLINKAP